MRGSGSIRMVPRAGPVLAGLVALAGLASPVNAQQNASMRVSASVIQVPITHQVTDSALRAVGHKPAALTLANGVRIVAEPARKLVTSGRDPAAPRRATTPLRRATIEFVAN